MVAFGQQETVLGKRLIACRNPFLARMQAAKRQDLLLATTQEPDKVKRMVEKGRITGKDKIGVRVGRVINKYKMAKHVALVIGDQNFDYKVRHNEVAAEAALDGIYVIRTSLPRERISAPDAVRSYKSLSDVERAFRSLKSIDLLVRPAIRHRLEDRVRAHIFLCMLSYYVEWSYARSLAAAFICRLRPGRQEGSRSRGAGEAFRGGAWQGGDQAD